MKYYEVYHHIPRYAVYHRKDGLKKIAARVHGLAQLFAKEAQAAGLTLASTTALFDTVLGQEKWGQEGWGGDVKEAIGTRVRDIMRSF